MYTIKKKLKPTCTSHYLGKGYPDKCHSLHGHNYSYEIEVGGKKLDGFDMLIDFNCISKICDNWLQENWDHTTIFATFQKEVREIWNKMNWKWIEFPIKDTNVTAEKMSEFLAEKWFKDLSIICPALEYVRVSVWETENSVAIFTVSKS